MDALHILAAPFAACLVLTGIHCYLGIHVVMRGVIFVDLALAQIAAMGSAVGLLAGYPVGSVQVYACSLGFTFLGAAVFALARFRDQRVPQEAMIGIVYAVSTALAILILSKTAVEREAIEQMLVGHLLFVEWSGVVKTLIIYACVGAVHFAFRRAFFGISRDGGTGRSSASVRAWDFVFYVTFGLVVTSSVQIAGVLLVFSFLVAPAVCAMMFYDSVSARLIMGWSLGMLGTVTGLGASLQWDLPPGVTIVSVFGLMVLLFSAAYAWRHRRRVAARPVPSGDASV